MKLLFYIFSVLFFVCGGMSTILFELKDTPDIATILCFYAVVFLLYLFGCKDVKDKEIPYHWWIVFIPFVIIGAVLGALAGPLCFLCALIPAVVVLALGWFRQLNGADAFGITAVLFAFCPHLVYGFVPVSWIMIIISLAMSLVMYVAVKSWRGHGVRYLAPLCLSVLVIGAVLL